MTFYLKFAIIGAKEGNIIEIIDLIEDREFPARRNITDFIILLLYDLNVEKSLIREIEDIIEFEYEKRGEHQVLSQSECRNKINQLTKKIKDYTIKCQKKNENYQR